MKYKIQKNGSLHKIATIMLASLLMLASVLAVNADSGNVVVTKKWNDGLAGGEREAPKVTVQAVITRQEILDKFYPVGTYYETADGSFDPNTEWGGTWEQVTDGRVLISSNATYAVGATGGETTHTLTPDETAMIGHYHTVNSHNHGVPAQGGSAYGVGNHMHHLQRVCNAQAGTNRYTANGGGSSGWGIGSAGSHSHTLSVNGTTTGGSQPGTSSTTAANGSAHNNMQPYKAVNRWHRTA